MPTTPLQTLHQQAAAANMAGSQAAFARFVGWDKAHITRLKQRGQVVLRADGQVDYAATIARIIGEADPARDAVRAQAAARRQAAANALDDRKPDPDTDTAESAQYATSRARKEHWLAETARVEYERLVGTLVAQAEVEVALEDAAGIFRSALENMPHRLAPELVGKDVDAIRAMLRGEVQGVLKELSGAFAGQGGGAA